MAIRRNRRTCCAAVITVLAAGGGLAACGSDDSSDDAGASTQKSSAPAATTTTDSNAAKLTKSPIKITAISFVDTPFGSEPGVFAGARGAARAINAKGGVNGHPIVVSTCNSQYQPATELACARKAVSSGATATAGNLAFVNSPANLEVWQQAGLANVGSLPTVPQDFNSPINFPIINFLSSVACMTAFPKTVGVSKVGVPLVDLAIARAGFGLDKVAATRSNVDLFNVSVPNTATDMTSYVQQLSNKGAQGVFIGLDPSKSPQFIKAAASLGKKWPYCHSDGVVTGGQLIQLGDAVSKFYVGSPTPPLTATQQYPELKTFISDMAAEKASGDKDADTGVTNYAANMLQAWMAVNTVAQVADTMKGTIDHTTFLAAIKKAKVDFGGIVPAIDFAKPNPHPGFARLFNPDVVLQRWDPDKKNFYLVPGAKPIDAVAAVSR